MIGTMYCATCVQVTAPHPPHHRADEDAGKPDEHGDREAHVQEALGDDADADDLRHHVDEGGRDEHDHADEPRHVAAEPGA